jgi:HPt (histidine-containing phosphotransfer) domain-containing protein
MTRPENASLEGYLNLAELLARVEDDRELLADLLNLFQEDFPRLRAALRSAAESGNAAETQKAAHALKGMLANLSMRRAAELAAGVEAAARAGDPLEIEKALAAFDREQQGLLASVNSFLASWDR